MLIKTKQVGGSIVVEVSDSGPGIPADLLPHVFDEFVSGKSSAGGTGLGLSITRQLARRHGGRITVSSEQGVGTCFELWLPLVAHEVEEHPVALSSARLASVREGVA